MILLVCVIVTVHLRGIAAPKFHVSCSSRGCRCRPNCLTNKGLSLVNHFDIPKPMPEEATSPPPLFGRSAMSQERCCSRQARTSHHQTGSVPTHTLSRQHWLCPRPRPCPPVMARHGALNELSRPLADAPFQGHLGSDGQRTFIRIPLPDSTSESPPRLFPPISDSLPFMCFWHWSCP